MARPSPLPAESTARLDALWRAGVPAKAIAAALGVPVTAVYRRRHALGLARRSSPTPLPGPEVGARFAADWKGGVLGKVLQHRYGLKKCQVIVWVRRLGLRPRAVRHALRRAA